MTNPVVVERHKRAGCRRQINRFSAALLIILGAIVAVNAWHEELAEFYGLPWLARPPAQSMVDAVNMLPGMPHLVLQSPEQQLITAFKSVPTAIAPPTIVPTVITNTPIPSNTPFPTATRQTTVAAPTPTNVVTSPAVGQVYYVVRSANLRPCPLVNNDCRVTDSLHIGTSVTITGEMQGDTYDGSTLWYSIEHNGQTSYLHSALVAPQPPLP
jgi:hypothetical protein